MRPSETPGCSPAARRASYARHRRGGVTGPSVPGAEPLHIDPFIVLGSAVVGLLVGLTGAGGGALMTPMLILLFGVKPSTAISSDLVAAVVMRPFGAAVHLRAGTVNLKLVRWLVIGSVPAAFLGAYLLKLLGNTKSAQTNIETALGAALLVGATAMVLRMVLDRSSGKPRTARISSITVKPLASVAIGLVGGVIVGMTSVGSGSLMIICCCSCTRRSAPTSSSAPTSPRRCR